MVVARLTPQAEFVGKILKFDHLLNTLFGRDKEY